jgi:Tfp pilus assembly protein PilN
LGGAGVGTVINLLPRTQRSSTAGRKVQISPKMFAVGAAFVVGIGGLTFMTQQSLSSAKSKRDAAEEQVARTASELAALQPILDRQTQIQALQASAQEVLSTDVAWQKMVDRITANLPAGVSLTTFSGQVTPPVPVVAAPVTPAADSGESSSSDQATTTTVPAPPAPVLTGTISFAGTAEDYPTLAAWIDAMAKVPQVADVYVTSAQQAAPADGSDASRELTFTAVAVVPPDALSDRAAEYTKAGS